MPLLGVIPPVLAMPLFDVVPALADPELAAVLGFADVAEAGGVELGLAVDDAEADVLPAAVVDIGHGVVREVVPGPVALFGFVVLVADAGVLLFGLVTVVAEPGVAPGVGVMV